MTSMKDVETIPVSSATGADPLVSEVASVRAGSVPGELDRQNGLWMIGLSANLAKSDLGQRGNRHRPGDRARWQLRHAA